MFRIAGSRFITKDEYSKVSLLSGSTIPACGSVFVTLGSDVIFNSPNLNKKIVNAGVWYSSDSSTITYEIARQDGNLIDIDRFFISALSGGTANIVGPIKDFPEHHSKKLPSWYKLNRGDKNA